jgi:hypothetical protein
MASFTQDQKIAMLVVPLLLFGMLGVSYASAAGRSFTSDEESTLKRAYAFHSSKHTDHGSDTLLRVAIQNKDYDGFVAALHDTPFHESATRTVFDTLVEMYVLHTEGKHDAAHQYLHNELYKTSTEE